VKNDCGLATALAGERKIEDVVQPLEPPRLFFVPAGPVPLNPAELVGSGRMRAVLAALRAQYDFVILDTPPVLPVNDAVVLSREADGTLLVVKGHDTPRELVRRARDRLALAGANVLGVVVNNVGLGWDDAYFYNPYYPFRGQTPVEENA
jgi:capsular exopolysaccharide synthesis family protein